MTRESKRRRWLIPLLAALAIGAYVVSTVEIGSDPLQKRPMGSADDIATLADRSDTNLLFILIDTLRADRMSAYGYERDTTPFLAQLARSGIRFDRHIAQSSWTKSSMASLWSSLSPQHVGVTKFNHTLSAEIRMPAEILAEAGFKTVGLYRNGWVSGYFGFDQGFEKYYRPLGSAMAVQARRLRPNAEARSTDEQVIADAIEFLRIHGHRKRWFLYLHLMDLHEYTYDAESALFGNSISDLYDNSLRRTDWVLSKLYDHLARTNLTQNTVLVVVSDHGEAFGERGFEGHARELFPETTETPVIISLPFRLPEPVVVTRRTDNVDVWPTLLDLLGLPDQGEVDGRSRLEDILAAASGGVASAPDGAAEGPASVALLDESWGSLDRGEIAVSVVDGPYRYVRGSNTGGRRFETLLSIEDGQKVDRLAAEPEVATRLREEAERQIAEPPRFRSDVIELDEMQLDQLRALGYELP